MKGTDLTPWQIQAAERFVRRCGRQSEQPSAGRMITLRFDELVRLVAWYGQIRANAVANGAPANEPGETYVVTPK